MLGRLAPEARALGTALVYCALRQSERWRDYVFDWQPALVAGLQLGVFDAGAKSCGIAKRLTGKRPTIDKVRNRLEWATTYVDDEHWARRQQRDLGIENVQLTNLNVNRRFGVTLKVSGNGASLEDAALVSLVRQALTYRRTDGAIVELGEQARLSIKLGEPVWARIGDETLRTPDAIAIDDLEELERRGVSFAQILSAAE